MKLRRSCQLLDAGLGVAAEQALFLMVEVERVEAQSFRPGKKFLFS